MADRVERLHIEYGVRVDESGLPQWANLHYTPVAAGQRLGQLGDNFTLELRQRSELALRAERLFHALTAQLGRQQLEIDGAIVNVQLKISYLWVTPDDARLRVHFAEASRDVGYRWILFSELSAAQRRLLDSVGTTIDRLAWERLRARLDVPTPAREELQVFISHRAGHERFAEALANRLGQEGIVPWFDKWEILAGDSAQGR